MIIGFVNGKGGVGKTTISTNLAFQYALERHKVALIDADPRQSIMKWCDDRVRNLPDNLSIFGMARSTLHRDIPKMRGDYEIIIIDGPANEEYITNSIVLSCTICIIPCTPSDYDKRGSRETASIVEKGSIFNEKVKPFFLINRKDFSTRIGKDIRDSIQSLSSNINILETEIKERTCYAQSSESLPKSVSISILM